ncbi:uncharacterized protein LOC113226163 [Hyposmocoma kahamanoa]|uniref:uncharacterized protein LOC113226163 n=1 Tax=Hyposmocoma kahamanoa TaxID=1477025 RepID=UPI000E6D5BEC|nr:uncharacterized protein LOC113226163 [Hyposmocoma kahamanoa]
MLTTLLFISLLTKQAKTSKKQVYFKQYAHSVFLHYPSRSKASEGRFCGGSLILAQVVVTSADCLKQMNLKDRITAYLGSSQPSKALAKLGVLSYKIHPKYNTDNIVYNLGVVFIGKPPPMGPYIRKIILPVGNRHKNRNDDDYVTGQPKQIPVTKSRLPALVELERDIAKKSNNSQKLLSSYTRKVVSGAVTHPLRGILGRKRKKPSKDEAFMVAWSKTTTLCGLDALSSRHLTGYKVHLLPFADCSNFLYNLSLPDDTFCTNSKFVKHIYDDPGCSLIVKKPMTQLIGIFSRLVRGVAVFINVDRHRSWIKQSTYQLYNYACNFGQLACTVSNTSSESTNCTVN